MIIVKVSLDTVKQIKYHLSQYLVDLEAKYERDGDGEAATDEKIEELEMLIASIDEVLFDE